MSIPPHQILSFLPYSSIQRSSLPICRFELGFSTNTQIAMVDTKQQFLLSFRIIFKFKIVFSLSKTGEKFILSQCNIVPYIDQRSSLTWTEGPGYWDRRQHHFGRSTDQASSTFPSTGEDEAQFRRSLPPPSRRRPDTCVQPAQTSDQRPVHTWQEGTTQCLRHGIRDASIEYKLTRRPIWEQPINMKNARRGTGSQEYNRMGDNALSHCVFRPGALGR